MSIDYIAHLFVGTALPRSPWETRIDNLTAEATTFSQDKEELADALAEMWRELQYEWFEEFQGDNHDVLRPALPLGEVDVRLEEVVELDLVKLRKTPTYHKRLWIRGFRKAIMEHKTMPPSMKHIMFDLIGVISRCTWRFYLGGVSQ